MNIAVYEQTIAALRERGQLPYSELRDIVEAFQVASGQAYAIAKTKAILNYLASHGPLRVISAAGEQSLADIQQFASLLRQLDPSLDIVTMAELALYFK